MDVLRKERLGGIREQVKKYPFPSQRAGYDRAWLLDEVDRLNLALATATQEREAARQEATDSKQVAELLLGLRAGMSSEAILRRFLGIQQGPGHYDYPYDSGDFGRCYRTLRICRIDVQCMTGASPVWDRLVAAWPEMERMYERLSGSMTERAFSEALARLINPA